MMLLKSVPRAPKPDILAKVFAPKIPFYFHIIYLLLDTRAIFLENSKEPSGPRNRFFHSHYKRLNNREKNCLYLQLIGSLYKVECLTYPFSDRATLKSGTVFVYNMSNLCTSVVLQLWQLN